VSIPLAVMVFLVGQRITPFVSLWSTMTNKESKPDEEGRSEGTGGGGLDRGEGRDGWVGICLALLVKGTTFDVFANEVGKTRPPVFGGNELAGFKITWMAGKRVIIRTSDDVAAKRTRVRDINPILVGKEAQSTCQSER
jgi:hypothetical protein